MLRFCGEEGYTTGIATRRACPSSTKPIYCNLVASTADPIFKSISIIQQPIHSLQITSLPSFKIDTSSKARFTSQNQNLLHSHLAVEKVFRYSYDEELKTFEQLDRLAWNYQEWRMTHNNSHIFISNGSQHIYVVDEKLNILQTLTIIRKETPLLYMN